MPATAPTIESIAFLGPKGTFCEEALRLEPDLRDCQLRSMLTISEAIRAAANGQTDAAFVPIENSIAGPVETTIDALARFENLTIQRDVELTVHLALVGIPRTTLESIERVISFPVAIAECRGYLKEHLPTATIETANSTAGAAQLIAQRRSTRSAAVASSYAADVYGLDVLADSIEDRPGNKTRFVLVVR